MIDPGVDDQPDPEAEGEKISPSAVAAAWAPGGEGLESACAPLRPRDPERIGPLRIMGRCATSAAGETFLGRGDGAPVLVTLLDAAWIEACGGTEGLLRTVMTARRLPADRGVAAVLDAALSGPEPYVVSEFVCGPSLEALIGSGAPVPGEALVDLAVTSATALAAIHDAGMAHNDVSPANLVIGPHGPRLVGVGLFPTAAPARPRPPAPELVERPGPAPLPVRVQSTRAAQRRDLVAWAATLAFAATGSPGYLELTGREAREVTPKDCPKGGMLTALPPPIEGVIRACLAVDATARPTARQVLERLTPTDAHAPPPSRSFVQPPAPRPPAPGAAAPGPPAPRPPAPGPPAPRPPAPRPPAPRPAAPRQWVRRLTRRRALLVGAVAGVLAGCLLGTVYAAASSSGDGHQQLVAGPSFPASTGRPATCAAAYQVVQSWPGGFEAEVTVTSAASSVHAWQVTWPLVRGQRVRQWWNAAVLAAGNRVSARNASYDGALGKNQGATFGVIVDGLDPGVPVTTTCTTG